MMTIWVSALGALTPDLHDLTDRPHAALAACIEEINLDPPVTLTEPSEEFVAEFAVPCRPEEDTEAASW